MNCIHLGRRAFLQGGTLTLAAAALSPSLAAAADDKPDLPKLRIGLVTDLHYADKPAKGTRHYRETPRKLAEAAEKFASEKPDFVVELGDLVDAADSVEVERKWLDRIARDFAKTSSERHCVLGNHCVDALAKEEFLGGVGQKESYYAFDRGGRRFLVLDACFRSDGVPYGRKNSVWDDANVPPAELEWLEAELKAAPGKVVVFAHQRLDEGGRHAVKNAAAVRKLFEASGKVSAVFQGHSHQNDYQEIGGVHYATLAAMIEGPGPDDNGFSLLEAAPDGSLRLTGFHKQKNYEWK